MEDRFDSMRARGINTNDATAIASDILQGKTAYAGGQKITGTLVPQTGNDLNIYVQSTTPSTPKGVWIKENASGDKYLASYYTKSGDFISPSSLTNLNVSGVWIGQVVVGNYLYHFGTSSSNSYKYDLRTNTIVNTLNVPTVSVANGTGAFYISNKSCIYVIYFYSSSFYYYKYYPLTDTYGEHTLLGQSDGSSNNIWGSCEVNGYIYAWCPIYYSSTYGTQLRMHVLNTDSDTVELRDRLGNEYVCGSSYANGNMIYIIKSTNNSSQATFDISQYNTISKSFSTLFSYNNVYGLARAIFTKGNYVYLFFNGTKYYLKYSISNNSYEYIESNTVYNISNSTCWQRIAFDEVGGRLYIRSYNTESYAYQLEDGIDVSGLNNGDSVIIQDLGYRNPVDIIDNPNIQIGVFDTLLVKNGDLDDQHMSCWGDGEMWHVIKNPNNETCTVSFDTDGGGSIASQTIVCGTVATAPSSNPSKQGYVFDEWYFGENPFDFNTPIAVDTTLVAHYVAYEEVDYIQSTGTQYIDTGVKPNENLKILADHYPLNLDEVSYPYGCVTGSTNRFQFGYNDSGYYYGWGSIGNTYSTTKTYARRTFEIDKGVFKENSTIITTASSTFDSNAVSIYLFALNSSSGAMRLSKMKIYSCQIYDDNTLVRDFTPIKLSTGEYCLLDKVENKVYHNMGTSEFIGEGYEPTYVDYLQSSGTQYINSRINPTQNIEIQIELENINTSTSTHIAGTRIAYQNSALGLSYQTETGEVGFAFAYGNEVYKSLDPTTTKRKYTYGDGTAYISNNLVHTFNAQTFSSNYPIYVFTVNNGGSPHTQYSSIKLYSCKIYNGNTLVRDYVPCIDTNNTPCLWDKVTKNFFYNAGTGTFNYGGVING